MIWCEHSEKILQFREKEQIIQENYGEIGEKFNVNSMAKKLHKIIKYFEVISRNFTEISEKYGRKGIHKTFCTSSEKFWENLQF